jgi:hypothetical protein
MALEIIPLQPVHGPLDRVRGPQPDADDSAAVVRVQVSEDIHQTTQGEAYTSS